MENEDTIFALASARGRAGVAVLRVSGPQAFLSSKCLAGVVPSPRKATLRTLWDGEKALDQALILTFEKGASFTGEDVVEFHLHGSVAVVQAVLDVLEKINGFRIAKAGEFTRRALENNRMDLAQVEGLADLINAETEAQRKQALNVMRGALSKKCDIWREKLLRATMLLEAVIDFVDEDVPVDVTPEVTALLLDVKMALAAEIDGKHANERVRDGFEVALVGRPNIGKSTLLNAIAGRDVAITSEVAGTTRDVIEVRMDIDGLPVTLLDLAGIHESRDTVESLGIERAIARANAADIRVFLVSEAFEVGHFGITRKMNDIVAFGKGDLNDQKTFSVSGKTGQGIDEMLAKIGDVLAYEMVGSSSIIRQRHCNAIVRAQDYIAKALEQLKANQDYNELASAEIRFAISSLDELIGRIDIEQVLGEIFAGFCIGK